MGRKSEYAKIETEAERKARRELRSVNAEVHIRSNEAIRADVLKVMHGKPPGTRRHWTWPLLAAELSKNMLLESTRCDAAKILLKRLDIYYDSMYAYRECLVKNYITGMRSADIVAGLRVEGYLATNGQVVRDLVMFNLRDEAHCLPVDVDLVTACKAAVEDGAKSVEDVMAVVNRRGFSVNYFATWNALRAGRVYFDKNATKKRHMIAVVLTTAEVKMCQQLTIERAGSTYALRAKILLMLNDRVTYDDISQKLGVSLSLIGSIARGLERYGFKNTLLHGSSLISYRRRVNELGWRKEELRVQ